jgi:2-oxoglutarate dehydrogenase E2 component (dihydrolipoamide succinyltransferase)
MRELRNRMLINALTVNDVVGGTFTLLDFSPNGVLFDTPVISPTQLGALGVGTVVRRPVVVSNPVQGESIAIRDMVYISLTYDNRHIGVSEANRFVGLIKARLEAADFKADFPNT